MEYTENYQFREPTPAVDIVKVGDINYNSRKIDELIHSTQVSLAPAYDATRTSENPYMTGDVVMKDALMYRCLDDDVYGAWDATKWERTTAGEEGTGGSSVEANPQGTPTDDLDTIGINGTIYNIAGSGGGGTALILDAQIYSTEERVVGVGANGKPLYQRTFKTSVLSAETEEELLSNVDSCYVVDLKTWNSTESRAQAPFYISTYSISGSGTEYGIVIFDDTTNKVSVYNVGRALSIVVETTIQYTKTTDTAGSGGYQAYGFSPIIYSTEEREVGVWIDNKPLYAKTYDLTNQTLTDNAWNNNILGTSNSGISIKGYDGYFSLGTTQFFPYSYYRGTPEYFTAVNGGDDIDVRPNMNAGAPVYAGIVNILYTKDSDTAGSGSYNTLGVPMVHYTTDEQVVGTYLGETLYQKTFTNMVLSTSGQSLGGYYAEINMTTLIANAENVKFIRGDYEVSNTKRDWSLGMYEPDYHTLYLITSAQRSNVNSTFTIQYTKSSS